MNATPVGPGAPRTRLLSRSCGAVRQAPQVVSGVWCQGTKRHSPARGSLAGAPTRFRTGDSRHLNTLYLDHDVDPVRVRRVFQRHGPVEGRPRARVVASALAATDTSTGALSNFEHNPEPLAIRVSQRFLECEHTAHPRRSSDGPRHVALDGRSPERRPVVPTNPGVRHRGDDGRRGRGRCGGRTGRRRDRAWRRLPSDVDDCTYDNSAGANQGYNISRIQLEATSCRTCLVSAKHGHEL